MTIDEAFEILNINDENISSDELRAKFNNKMQRCENNPFLRNYTKKIRLANQMVRNYRESQNWSGTIPPNWNRSSNMAFNSEKSYRIMQKKESLLVRFIKGIAKLFFIMLVFAVVLFALSFMVYFFQAFFG